MPTQKITPARAQYLDIKHRYPNAIVLFRMGDFYEAFDDDAELVARELDLTLTSRPLNRNEKIPMAGVPHHAVEGYIARLVEKGYHVAVVDQMGNEAVNGVVPREVTQVVTPGTVIAPSMLPDRQNNYLIAIIPEFDYKNTTWSKAGLAYVDITTGEFGATELVGEDTPLVVLEELARLSPREAIMPKSWVDRGVSMPETTHLTALPDFQFDLAGSRTALLHQYKVATLEGFGLHDKPLALRASGAIIQYLQSTQPSALNHLTSLRIYTTDGFMALDATTRISLEIARSMRSGSVRGSLLDIVDRTTTAMGARLLRAWLNQPLLDLDRLNARLDAVEVFYHSGTLRAEVEAALRQIADLERLVNRIIMDKAGPRDFWTLGQTLSLIPNVRNLVAGHAPIATLIERLQPLPSVIEMIENCLEPDCPALMNQVGVIRDGFNPELDKIRDSASHARHYIANLESAERERTGINSLKVGYNKVFGYYIEVTHTNTSRVPDHYIRKQTLVNAERYITPEMKTYEATILSADTHALEVEQRIFKELGNFVKRHADTMLAIARAIAHLDVFVALADVAARNGYTRPYLVTDDVLDIRNGRHPVVETSLSQGQFVPNDTYFDPAERLLLITGPNMAGKSVYMRQVAQIVLLAQIGSFIPVEQATIGLVDRIFARVGAQDEIHRGQSTFMVEMTETAAILTHATPRSLVLLDEIGRGTSTYDGMAIARAVIEYLHNSPRLGCKTLFATHYHELTELENILPRVRNYNVAVADDGDQVVFLHRLVPGGASQSYGIHVAQLAGVPKSVVNRAKEILQELEAQGGGFEMQQAPDRGQISLFDDRRHPVIEALRRINVESISPIDAITQLYELKRLLNEDN